MPLSPEGPDELLRHLAASCLLWRPEPRHIGLAVSGGGDSVAMLRLIAPVARERGLRVSVATVDHGLRPESAREARWVGETCTSLGLPHDILRWEGWHGRGNLQAAARDARRGLLRAWAGRRGADSILLGHTADDEAERFLMRLARGSGVDGLGEMRTVWDDDGVRWMRPLLFVRRKDLREFLVRHGQSWVEDPSNGDDRFARTQARRALEVLEPLGIDPDRLGTTAVLLRWASEALGHWAADVAGRIAEETTAGDVSLALDAFVQLPYETHLRLATTAIRWVSSSPYRPRLQALQPGLAAAAVGRRATLGGALLGRVGKGHGRRVVIGREPRAAARAPAMPTTAIWDGRWQVSGPHAPDLQVRMLGEAGLSLCPDWRSTGLSRASLIASPAVWRGEALVAAPLAGRAEGWTAKVVPSFLSVLRGSR